MKSTALFSLLIFILFFQVACTLTGPSGIFGKRSPHEQYSRKLTDAGLRPTALGTLWFSEAEKSLNKPLIVSVPYKESGYFAAERPRAAALKFEAKRGQRISISLQKKPASGFTIYVDLWELKNGRNKKLLAYADTNASPFTYDIEDEGTYILRLQPELLSAGEYTLVISSGPSLAFPVKSGRIGSFWGDNRDRGARRHEGIDIFAAKRTPVIAAAEGIINRVGENNLGGKVIFLRPKDKNYSLYYAHLDEHLVRMGQRVSEGDTIGLVGNTGNAKHTSPHLHFGIYAMGGAVDPFAFVNPNVKRPLPITASISQLGRSLRTVDRHVILREAPNQEGNSLAKMPLNTLVLVEAACSGWYKVSLPDDTQGYISSSSLSSVSKPLKLLTLKMDSALLDKPQKDAARKLILKAGSVVEVLGLFGDFSYVSHEQAAGWLAALK